MTTSLGSPVQYRLPVGDESIPLNDYIGNRIALRYTGEIYCIECGRRTNKSFNQGYCYPCFQTLAACDMCIMKPETCHYHAGTCREPHWGEANCLQHHYVYLANSSGIKVGITRGTQLPTRWIDQGASQALAIFRVANRLLSGKLEVALKAHVSDRTDWRRMLKAKPEVVDLRSARDELLPLVKKELMEIQGKGAAAGVELLTDAEPVDIDYPVEVYPDKVKTMNFDKHPTVEGILHGIKGQYLILDGGVLNIRKFAGYRVRFG